MDRLTELQVIQLVDSHNLDLCKQEVVRITGKTYLQTKDEDYNTTIAGICTTEEPGNTVENYLLIRVNK